MLERILVTFGTPVLICVVLPVLLVWLVAGLAVGVLATVLAFLYPIDASSIGEGLWQSIRLFLQEYRQYIVNPVAAMAITLSIVLSSGVMS